uniref:Peroxisomal membrane protein MPV17 n=1 Tax=Chaetoceros debilis TaxID=122233 RepID=A0A7S3PZB9_9STRA
MQHKSVRSKMKTHFKNLLVAAVATVCSVNAFSPTSLATGVRGANSLSSHSEVDTRGSASALHLDAGVTDSLVNAWTSYNIALEEDPLLTKSITAGVILGAADFAGQALERSNSGEDNPVDYARAARFAFFGFILQAPWNHFYYLFLDGALPPTEDPLSATTGIKVVIDQFVQAPIFTVIIFFFLGLLEGKSASDVKEQLDRDYKDTMFANWKLWVPATAVNIAFCPPILRVLFLNCVFFFWSIFLSLKLNSDGEEAPKE